MAWKHNKKRGGKVVIGSETYTIDAQGFIHRAGDYAVAPETAETCVRHPNYRQAEHPSELEKAAAEKAAAEKNGDSDDSKDEKPEPKGKSSKKSKKGKGK